MPTSAPFVFGNLSFGDKLELVARSPLFRELAVALPKQGGVSKRALTTTLGTLVIGVATIVAGSDRRADAELRYQWPILRPRLAALGIEVSETPPTSQHFRDYRARYLTATVVDFVHELLRLQGIRVAKLLGLLTYNGEPFDEPSVGTVVYGDGKWFKPASDVGHPKHQHNGTVAPHPSRAQRGARRVVPFDVQGRNYGYNHVTLYVRGSTVENSERKALARKQVALALVRAVKGAEMQALTPEIERLRSTIGDGFRCFTYDGAMEGKHHRHLRRLGILTVNKPKTTKSLTDWTKGMHARLGEKDHLVEVRLAEGCVHYLNVHRGLMFKCERDALGRWARHTVLEHVATRRADTATRFRWEVDLVIHCEAHGTGHIWTVDPTDTLVSTKGTVNLAQQFRIVAPNHNPAMRRIYGTRNCAESHNKWVKSECAMGDRARSFTPTDHEFDRLLVLFLHNALALAEHGPECFRANA